MRLTHVSVILYNGPQNVRWYNSSVTKGLVHGSQTLKITIDIDIFHYCSHVLHFHVQTSIHSIFDPNMDPVKVLKLKLGCIMSQ
jgi:hypothetical protein